MATVEVEPDKYRERVDLLGKCLSMPVIRAHGYAMTLTEEQFLAAINGTVDKMVGLNMRRPAGYPENYFGEFYTIENYRLSAGNVWERLEADILRCLKVEPEAREVLDFFLNQVDYEADFTGIKARFARWRNTLDALLGFKLLRKLPGRAKDVTTYALHAEMVPLLRRVLASEKAQDLPTIRCEAAQAELANVEAMEKEFEDYLRDLLDKRLDEVQEFGREHMSIERVARYLEDLFGPMLYFDILLGLAQQYGMTATEIINQEGVRAADTGFHLALFGAPGTGKTFAVKDLIMGDEGKGVKAHGLPGLNRYCGGMTAANFIRIGEAYQGKRFNFVVTEFNDWFRYKGMVEPLKLALEQGRIRYETKTETVGPYQFSCYFSTNYNTQVSREAGYRVTVSDPNFNAIEDRMLVRMHRMTKQRLRELSRNQRALAMGRLRMHLAGDIRNHLALVYAIQTGHPLVRERFERKQIVLRESFFEALERAQELLLEQIRGDLLFSVRVRQNAIKLAGALTLFSYFQQPGNRLEIPDEARNLALKFFVEEVAIRQKIGIDVEAVLYRLGLNELNRVVRATTRARSELRRSPEAQDPGAFLDCLVASTQPELKLAESKYAPDTGWDKAAAGLVETLGAAWKKLDDNVQQFLSTGEVLLAEMERLGGSSADYAAVVVEYSKALELQLLKAVFEPAKDAVRKGAKGLGEGAFACSFAGPELSEAEKADWQRTAGVLKRFIVDDRPPTLGEMWHVLRKLRSDLAPAPVFAALAQGLRASGIGKKVLTKRYAGDLGRYLELFRNAAAHTGALTRKKAQECREALLGADGGLLLPLLPQ